LGNTDGFSEDLAAENLSLAGQRELRIEGRPIDLVAQFDARQRNAVRIQAVEEFLKVCFREFWISKRERRSAPHGEELIWLVGS